MAVESLKKLHTALVDTRAAYELALKDTDDDEVGRICKEMISLRHVTEILTRKKENLLAKIAEMRRACA